MFTSRIFCLSVLCFLIFVPDSREAYNLSLVKNITRLLDTILDNYDRKFRPKILGPPVEVLVHISVLGMGYISEKNMEFSLDCYFRQRWFDDRLKFTGPDNMNKLALAPKVLQDIWRPDTYIKNGRGSYLHTLTMPNILLRVNSNGEVYVSQRLTIRARCPMYLRKFPMDTQACPLIIGSLGFNRADLVYKWKDVDVDYDMPLSQYKIENVIRTEQNVTDIRNPRDETISILQVHFKLRRQQGYYLLQIYTPCSLIVIMSWVSFWINKEASPARVSLGIMTVLTMSALGLGGRDELPKVSYSTALDMYIVACFGFVFAALVEYAVVNFAHIVYIRKAVAQMRRCTTAGAIQQMRMMTTAMLGGQELPSAHSPDIDAARGSRKSEVIEQIQLSPEKPAVEACFDAVCCRFRRTSNSTRASGLLSAYTNIQEQARKKLKSDNPSKVVDKIDTISKFLFPSLYFLFNGLYWSAFLYWIPDEIDSIPSIRENLVSQKQ